MLKRKTIRTHWIETQHPSLAITETSTGLVPVYPQLVKSLELRDKYDMGLVLDVREQRVGALRHFLRVGASRSIPFLGIPKGAYQDGQRRGCFTTVPVFNRMEEEGLPELLVVGRLKGDAIHVNPRPAWFIRDATLTRVPDACLPDSATHLTVRDHLNDVRSGLAERQADLRLILGQTERGRLVTYAIAGTVVAAPGDVAVMVPGHEKLVGFTKRHRHTK